MTFDSSVITPPGGARRRPPRALRWLQAALRRRRTTGAVLLHGLLVVIGYRLAYELRFDFHTPAEEVRRYWLTLPLLLGLRLGFYALAGVFRVYWRHFGLQDMVTVAEAATLSTLSFIFVLTLVGEFPGTPRSVLLMDWAGAILFAGGISFVARAYREAKIPFIAPPGRRTLVVGAGEMAERLLREVRRDQGRTINVVGLVDPGDAHSGGAIGGVRIIGAVNELPALAARHDIEFIIIALDPADDGAMRRVIEQCIATGLKFKTLPSLDELLNGTAGMDQLRNVEIEDLLGRPPVNLDLSRVDADLRGRSVLVTGAAGSIGSELARQIARFRPARLILLDQAESELYFVHLELCEAHADVELVPVICDIANADRVGQVYALHQPDYVVHAAAYKHVPLMEANVVEAVRNNVLGTLVVASAAVRHGVKKFLLISTDKAINPSSVMGASKRIAERIVFGLRSLHGSATEFRAVRFGNVLASNGSVIPVFERQLAAGGPITVTHPEVQRYFMTIPEAVQLVLQAGSLPETRGAMAMLDMGEPVRVLDLAEKLIRISGRVPGKDVQIVFTGLRPGEKLTEDLVSAYEELVPTSASKIRVSQTPEPGGAELEHGLNRLLNYLDLGDREGLLTAICDLVPECTPPLREWYRGADGGPDVRRPGERHSPDLGHQVRERRTSTNERRRSARPPSGRRRMDRSRGYVGSGSGQERRREPSRRT